MLLVVSWAATFLDAIGDDCQENLSGGLQAGMRSRSNELLLYLVSHRTLNLQLLHRNCGGSDHGLVVRA